MIKCNKAVAIIVSIYPYISIILSAYIIIAKYPDVIITGNFKVLWQNLQKTLAHSESYCVSRRQDLLALIQFLSDSKGNVLLGLIAMNCYFCLTRAHDFGNIQCFKYITNHYPTMKWKLIPLFNMAIKSVTFSIVNISVLWKNGIFADYMKIFYCSETNTISLNILKLFQI